MGRLKFLWPSALLFAVAACATPYADLGPLGGYQDSYIGDDQYHITVRGNGFSSVGTAEEYFYRRAQEITQQHGYATYRVVQFQSGMERLALGYRPVASGVIQLSKNEQRADGSSGQTIPAPQGADTSPATSIRKTGSGFFVDALADTLTNYHVVKGCSEISISGPVPEIRVAILASDPPADLALLHPAENLSVSPLRFREGAGPRAGDSVVAIGFPLQGLLASEPNVTTGTVSALAGMKNDDRYVQITAPVQPGNSGGPLLDMSGNVVGVVSAKLDALKLASITGDVPENVNFAVKYLIARNFLDTHGVRYETAVSTAEISAADIADRARKSTVFVSCR